MPELSNWMRGIHDDTLVSGMIMPGSHDAGVAKTNVELNYGVKESWAVCQYGPIAEQALHGSRFFDCRVFYQAQSPDLERELYLRSLHKRIERGDSIESQVAFSQKDKENKYKKLRFGHFSGERQDATGHGGIGGAYGGVLKVAIREAIQFVREHDSEFLILRFSHSGWPEKLAEVMKHWYAKYNVSENWQTHIYRSAANIATVPLRDLRGKVVMIFDGKHTSLDPALGLHRFSKYKGGGGSGYGLSTCGTYAASSDVKTVLATATQASEAHFYHGRDHLHFVYYQQTMSLESIEAATTKPNEKKFLSNKEKPNTGGIRAQLPGFLGELQRMAAAAPGTHVPHFANVISHDFVDPVTCHQIVSLNPGFQW
jgi:hypothetical protein